MRVSLAIVVLALVALPLIAQEDALASAARANDFATFDALYRVKPVEAFRPLHELWTYSVTDPGGAFYGQERYQQLAGAYPTFAATVGPHRIVDSRGNVFYPSAETRAFLLAQAERGTTVARSAPPPTKVTPAKPAPVTKVAPATPPPAPPLPPVRRKRLTKASLIAPPPTSIPPATTIVTTATTSAPKPADEKHVSGRGLLLVIIGLVGTGVLALIVRAPSEVPSIRNP